jgi:hypothetical protein
MRNTNRVTRAARAVALVGSTLMALALALLASPGYADADRVDQGRDRVQGVAGQVSQLRAMIALRSRGQGLQVQSNGSGDLDCTGLVVGGDFDSVTVPEGETCTLVNSSVDGNVTVEEDSLLFAQDNMIGGNLTGDAYDRVNTTGNSILGNVQLRNGRPSASGVETFVCDSLIDGNVSVQRNIGTVRIGSPAEACPTNLVGGNFSVTDSRFDFGVGVLDIRVNLVGGDMRIEDNRGNGSKRVQGNMIDDTLDCKDNQNPFIGTPNDADRTRGQCAQ